MFNVPKIWQQAWQRDEYNGNLCVFQFWILNPFFCLYLIISNFCIENKLTNIQNSYSRLKVLAF